MTVEREGIRWARTLVSDRPNPVIDVPITGDFAPNAYVSIAVFGPETEAVPATIRIGYVMLTVAAAEERLRVDVETDKLIHEPGEPARIAISVRDADGAPQEAEVTVALIDAAAPPLAEQIQPTPWEAFYGPRPLRIVTGDSLLIAADRSAVVGGGPGAEDGTAFGGPHAIGDVAVGNTATSGKHTETELPRVAYFRGAASTDAQGHLGLTIDLPDTLSTYELRVWAITRETEIGEATKTINVSKALHIQPISPPFLVAGDRTEFAALVHNNTNRPMAVDVGLQLGEVLRLESAPVQQVVVAAGEHERVAWTVMSELGGGGAAEVRFSARSGEHSDVSVPRTLALDDGWLPVRRLTDRDVSRVAGVLADPGSWVGTLVVPSETGMDGEAVVRVDTSLISMLQAGTWP